MILTKTIESKVVSYLKSESNPLICIVWPTWCWKTQFAVELAKKIKWELINADSRQVYKEIECITGLDYEEIKEVKHHMFWINNLDQGFTVADFLGNVRSIISNIQKVKWVPIIVWWTWLFISSLIEWFEIPENSRDPKIKDMFIWKTNEDLLNMLNKVDKESADVIHVNNRVYLERALEVYHASWMKKSDWIKNKKLAFNALIISKQINSTKQREDLYDKINQRQEFFFHFSLNIIKLILDRWLPENLQSLQSIWIPEIKSYLSWDITKQEAVLLMQQKARNYAKRQLTWWRPKKEKFNFIETD